MRHLKKGRKLGRERNQRRALMKSMASSFFLMERIKTTEAKAKEIQPFIEKFITTAKKPTLANKRRLAKFFSAVVCDKIFKIAELEHNRKGGYTRIIRKKARNRDNANMAIIELVR